MEEHLLDHAHLLNMQNQITRSTAFQGSGDFQEPQQDFQAQPGPLLKFH